MIRVSRGKWRTALVISGLGIALKLSNVRIGVLWRRYKSIRSVKDLKLTIVDELNGWYLPASIFSCLFGGWLMNFREFFFSFSYGSSSLVLPTYFSFFGLMNIMPAGEECTLPDLQIWEAALTVAEFKELDPHTWSNSKNFIRDRKGRLRLADYGDSRTRQALCLYREGFERAFAAL